MLKINNFIIKFLLLIIVISHIVILSKTIFFPYPEIFVYPYLTNHGFKPFSETIDQHFPGLFFLPINFNNLGMTTPEIARIWLISAVVITHLLIFFVGKKIFAGSKTALFVNFLYLVWQPFLEGWVLWIDTFLPLFYLPAFYLTYKIVDSKDHMLNRNHLILLGVFFSVAVIFKQVALPLAGLVGLLLLYYKRDFKIIPYFLIGFLPFVLIVLVYYWQMGILNDFIYWTITYNLTTFAEHGRKYGDFASLTRVIFIYSPLLLVPFIKERKLAATLFIFIVGSLTATYARFDFVHFQPSLPFILLLTVTAAISLSTYKNLSRLVVILYVLIAINWLSTFYKGHLGDKVFFYDQETLAIRDKIIEYTDPLEEIYIFGSVSHLYQLSNTLPVGKVFVLQFPWFLMETEGRFMDALKTNPPKLVVRDRTVTIVNQPITVFAKNIDQYIEEHYYVIDKINNTEFMRYKQSLNPAKIEQVD